MPGFPEIIMQCSNMQMIKRLATKYCLGQLKSIIRGGRDQDEEPIWKMAKNDIHLSGASRSQLSLKVPNQSKLIHLDISTEVNI